MIKKTFTEIEESQIIDMLFVHFELHFTGDGYPLSNLQRDTKIGDILEAIITHDGQTVKEFIEKIALESTISIEVSYMPETNEDIANTIQRLGGETMKYKADIEPIISFFSPLTILDVIKYNISLEKTLPNSIYKEIIDSFEKTV